MEMNVKAKVDEIVEKIKSDKDIAKKFQKDPSGVIGDLIGVEIPKEQFDSVVTAVKAKINLDSVSGALGGLFGKK